MSVSKTITVKQKDAGARLDIFLSEKLKISRSQTQKLIAGDRITVNGKSPKKAGDAVKTGDEIYLKKPDKKIAAAAAPAFSIKDIKIIAATPDYLVVEKPAGMLTHPTLAREPDALSALLAKKYPEIKKVGDGGTTPPGAVRGKKPDGLERGGIVHRLDKEASGLLVVARKQTMFEHLKTQFKNHTVDKEYLVLAHGKITKDEDVVNFPIARGENDRMVALPKTKHGIEHDLGKPALTEFVVDKRFINFTLLRIKIHTGRMHQIRVHLLAYDHPVVGDMLYFQKKNRRDLALGRLFLHCTRLAFTDLAGAKQEFQSPLPVKLKEFLETLS